MNQYFIPEDGRRIKGQILIFIRFDISDKSFTTARLGRSAVERGGLDARNDGSRCNCTGNKRI